MADTNDDLERLLAHQGWLRRLTRALISDPAAADDAAQETWVRVLQKQPSAVESPRAWLARIARRVAGEQGRDENARKERERRVAFERNESVEDPDWASRVEFAADWQRRIVRAVLELPEPARSTVVLRYFEGRTSAEIARASGARESTVRNRLRRALEELREKLDREAHGDRGRWLAALLPFANEEAVVVSSGGLLMGAMAKVAAVGAFAVLVALPFCDSNRAADEPSAVAARPKDAFEPFGHAGDVGESVSRVATPAILDPAPRVEPSASAAEPAQPSPPAAGCLELLVLEEHEGQERPVIGADVWLGVTSRSYLPRDFEERPESTRTARLDAGGRATFVDVPPGTHPVGVRTVGGSLVQKIVRMPSREGVRVVIRLGAGSVSGVVFDYDGEAVAGARVSFGWPYGRWHDALYWVLWTDNEGRYSVQGLPPGEYSAGVNLSGWQNPAGGEYKRALTLARGEDLEHDFGNPSGLPCLRGVVRTRAGDGAFRGGSLHATQVTPMGYRHVAWGDDGVYELPLEFGEWEIALALPGRDAREVVIEKLVIDDGARAAGAPLIHDIELAGATVEGVVGSGKWIALRASPTSGTSPLVWTQRPESGRYRFDGIEPGRWWLTVDDRAYEFSIDPNDHRVIVDAP